MKNSNSTFSHSRSKMISSYGGIGSVVETVDNSVIIESFDNWEYPTISDAIERYIIKDDRLLSRLKYIFKSLNHIVGIPDEDDHSVRIKSNYFPKWFYCPKCRRFSEYYFWKNSWHSSGKNLELFYPPKCYYKECYETELEQVRFILTCPNGHIQDIPWKFWNNRTDKTQAEEDYTADGEEDSGSIFLNFQNTCCGNKQDLRYNVSRENSELSGIHIECKNCGKSEDLNGIFGFKMKCPGLSPWLGNNLHHNCDEKMKVVIKSSNSVYYANTLSSIYLPVNQIHLDYKQRERIINFKNNGWKDEDIANLLKIGDGIPSETTLQFLQTGEYYISEQAYREIEYDYFLKKESELNESIIFSKIPVVGILEGFEYLIKIDKLKQISVQTSFTRQLPIDIDAVLSDDDDEQFKKQYEVTRQPISKNNFKTRILPGIESYGEAILFILEKEKLISWINSSNVHERTTLIKSKSNNSQRNFVKNSTSKVSPQFLLLHTLSHLIIKELEYVCGYPAASLKERLYVSDKMFGFMIMAIEGSEGSLGGLVSQCINLENIKRIISSALERAKDCSTDPICWNSDGQGTEGLNLAACYSCALLPDISCEEFNCFLDRKMVIDNEYGFFKQLHNNL
jgi:hypothetical protein